MKRLVFLVSLLAALALVATASAGPSGGYDATPKKLPPNVPSVGYQATQTSEFGDYVHLDGKKRKLDSVTVIMSDWARYSEYTSDARYSGDSKRWTHPITVNIYSNHLDGNGVPDQLLVSLPETVKIPWRPEGDPTCPDTGYGPGFAWRAKDGLCYNGFAFRATFEAKKLKVNLPADVIVGIAYNTQSYGAVPIGINGPYNSLNVAVPANQPVSRGSDDNTDAVFWNTSTANNYTDGGSGGVGTFRQDTNWTPNGTVAMQVKTSG